MFSPYWNAGIRLVALDTGHADNLSRKLSKD